MVNADQQRVLMLCGQLGAGGAPKVVLNLTKHLVPEVDDVAIAYLGGRDDLVPAFAEHDIPVTRLGEGSNELGILTSLWRLIHDFRPTVIHTHMISAACLGRVVGRIRKIPVISTLHTSYANRSKAAKLLDFSTSFFSTANVSVSSSVEATLPSYFGLGARSVVIHNCVDPDDLRKQGNVTWEEAVWNDGISKSQPIIANVTRFDPKKRKGDLVRALPAIHREFPDAALVLTGWGPHQKHVEEIAQTEGVKQNTFFVGEVPNPYSVYRHSDIVAFPSISEGFSIGILEAMAFGKPIVATEIPPFREALGEDYPLVPPCDPSALAKGICRFLREPEYATKLSEHLREHVEREFSGQKAAQSYLDVYQSFCE
ncbi:glycosyltransferase [Haloarcula sp. 1CSR25-25]|uniref:glycosyltransferase n=1 Tax=Haloarcula sp. 1CSR25-25 TaxID=2862545 RepID=UPI002895F537|nr:glycosyltransferase [Haloarcula sp. 1CSR25-25]MDT3435478.1 glycosyltransferase [Haloarcula sp. 1CSR25-25]